MQINLFKILYLGFRLMPFAIVSMAFLVSLFLRDLRVLIYLLGLVIACFVTFMVGEGVSRYIQLPSDNPNSVCGHLTLTGGLPFSKMPLSLVVYSYSLWYILFIILTLPKKHGLRNDTLMANLSLILFLGVMFLLDFVWLLVYCNVWWKLVLTGILGGVCAVFWCLIIASNGKTAAYQYNPLKAKEKECILGGKSYQCH